MQIVNRTLKRAGGGAGVLLLAAALVASAAFAVVAPEQTREAYVAQVEPICKKNTQANERILKGVRKKIQQGKTKAAAGQFTQAAAAFKKAVVELRAVPQPPEDSAKLTKWLKKLDVEAELLGNIGKALKDGNKGQAQSYFAKLTSNGNLANSTVLGFDFNHCLIDSSKFT
jgi:hypothetical protein